MIINLVTYYDCGDRVAYRCTKNDLWKEGLINAVRVWSDKHSAPDYYVVYYSVEPIELMGMEHDDDEWIHSHKDTIRPLKTAENISP